MPLPPKPDPARQSARSISRLPRKAFQMTRLFHGLSVFLSKTITARTDLAFARAAAG